MSIDTIIIGAGLSGLVAARQLQQSGQSYLLLEKGSIVGGRLETIAIDSGVADVGAQFFSAREHPFQQAIEEWKTQGLVFDYGNDWSDGSIKRMPITKEPRYAVKGGMQQLANELAKGLTSVRLHAAVQAIQWKNNLWHVQLGEDETLYTHNLIITAPVPIALNLLLDVPLEMSAFSELNRIQYAKNLTGIFVIDGETTLPPSGGLQMPDGDSIFHWIGDNRSKGISATTVITAQAKRLYSQQNFTRDDEAILATMRAALQEYLKAGAIIQSAALKRWEYGSPITTYPYEILQDNQLPIIFAGDAFGGYGRVEGAYLSGLAAGKAIVKEQAKP